MSAGWFSFPELFSQFRKERRVGHRGQQTSKASQPGQAEVRCREAGLGGSGAGLYCEPRLQEREASAEWPAGHGKRLSYHTAWSHCLLRVAGLSQGTMRMDTCTSEQRQ